MSHRFAVSGGAAIVAPVRFRVLAADYDRTLADDGVIAPATLAALARVRASGRRTVLVTGRRFDDLLQVCPQIGTFDLAVAENGAVLYEPASGRITDLVPPPPASFLGGLAAAGVPFQSGRVIIATVVPHDTAVERVIRAHGLPLHVVFNRESVMILPAGVSKRTGFEAALAGLEDTVASAVAVGDGENDVELLRGVGLGVAVANAVPMLRSQADLVTSAPNGAGVCELIDGLLRDDLSAAQRVVR